jgi:hypothetical protein
MTRLRKATLALPVLLIVAGLAVPVVVDGGSSRPPAPPAKARYAGRTADEWRSMGAAALEEDRFGLALRYMKTAERVSPGAQFAKEIRGVREARRRAQLVDANCERMLGGDVAGVEISDGGEVVSAYRLTVALPGESLWSLAGALAAARAGLLPSELEERVVYSVWDSLTERNGLRELEVGEVVRVPLSVREMTAMSGANAEDLERIRLANAALDSGRVDMAAEMRGALRTDFVLNSDAVASLDDRIRLARARELVDSARSAIELADGIERTSEHGELLASLRTARQELQAASRITGRDAADEIAAVDALLAQAERYTVADDGTILATKPAGVPYTEFVRETVEWFIGRPLEHSGAEFPDSYLKTPDEFDWSEYMLGASAMAGRNGVDFAALLVDTGERPVALPNPGGYFDH